MVDAEQGFSPERIQLLEREGERAQAVEASYKTRALFSMFNNKPGLSYNPQESLYRLDGTNTWLKSVSSKGDNISIDFLPEERSASERLQLKRNKTGSYSVVYRKRVGFTFTRVALEFHKDEERGEIAITKIDIKGGASTGYIGLDRWNLLKRVSDCVGVAGQAVREVYVDNGVTQEKVIPENLPGDSLSAFQRMIEQRSSRPTKKTHGFYSKKRAGGTIIS